MKSAIFTQLPAAAKVGCLPSLASRKGQERLEILGCLVGEEAAPKVAEQAGFYLLEDSLAHELRLRGLELAKGGELPALSPARWKKTPPEPASGGRLIGILLSPEKKSAFTGFLAQAGREFSLDELVLLAGHFFYEDSLNLLFEYTEPSFNQP
jgi:hypothetical protein